jgi:hypothetical protein
VRGRERERQFNAPPSDDDVVILSEHNKRSLVKVARMIAPRGLAYARARVRAGARWGTTSRDVDGTAV